ncbi:carbohydrate ABC transporter permease, partial [Sutterella wadsworthensis]
IGPINLFLRWLGFAGIPFFSSPEWSMFSLAIIGVWQLAGFNMVLFLAGLTAIPSEIQDAATLDGADSFWRRLFTVTLPLLSPTMLFVVTTSSITAFKLFDAVAVLTKGGPQGATDVLLYATYREGFENLNTAGAAAMTVVFLVIIVAASWIQARISEKRVYYK